MLFLLGCIACIALDVGCCYRRMVSLCICLSVMFMSPAKTAELIKMPFGELTQVGPRNHVLDGDPQIPQGRHFGGLFQVAHWKAWGVLDWAVPKLLNQSRCHLGAESWNHVRKKNICSQEGWQVGDAAFCQKSLKTCFIELYDNLSKQTNVLLTPC